MSLVEEAVQELRRSSSQSECCFEMDSKTTNWLCCQLGAREHYAMPRALHRAKLLDRFLTDAWIPPWFLLRKLSGLKFADRFHHELSSARVSAFNSSLMLFELLARARRLGEWQTILARNRWFQRNVSSVLRLQVTTPDSQQILLSYSYTAVEPFRYAKSHGWKTVLVQIDPGPEEEKIVAEEVIRVPSLSGDWRRAPAEYWAAWRDECDLADHIVINSEWSREALVRSGIPGEKLSVIPLAYEESTACSGEPTAGHIRNETSDTGRTRMYPARFTNERPMRVLFLGQVNLRKGIARLLDAAWILRTEPAEFWIVGPVQLAAAKTFAPGARVKWFGPATRRQAAEKYQAADIFILPTLSDGFAITQLEAQAYGLPVIASRFCGSVVDSGRNGMVLQEPSAACIAAAIRDCIADPGKLQNFAAGSHVANGFSLDTLAQRLQRLGARL